MATRFYFPASGTPPVSSGTLDPPSTSRWALGTSGFDLLPMVRTKTDTALVGAQQRTPSSYSTLGSRLDRIYVSSEQLAAQTISGTFSAVFSGIENNAALNAWLDIIMRVVSADGSTTRGAIYSGSTATSSSTTASAENKELQTTQLSSIKSAIALTSLACQAGDRLVVEVGARKSSGGSAGQYYQLWYGDEAGTSDFALTGNLNFNRDPWVEFSGNLTFLATGPPTKGQHFPFLA